MNGVNPSWAFWLGIVIFLEQGIGQGTVKLTNVIPEEWIPYVVAWCALLAWAGGAVQTALIGFSNSKQGPLLAPTSPAAKGIVILALALTALFTIGVSDARAQDAVVKRIISGGAQNVGASPSTAGIPRDLLGALDEKILPDLTYAKAMADATGSAVTSGCYGAWIKIIQSRQQALKGADGQPLALPEAHLITDFERVVELRNALQPTSEFSIACSPVANMVKKDILNFIGVVMGGGASLSLLGIGL